MLIETAAASWSAGTEKEMSLGPPSAVGSLDVTVTGPATSGVRSSLAKRSISVWLSSGAGALVGASKDRCFGHSCAIASTTLARSTVSPGLDAVFLIVVPSSATVPSTGFLSSALVLASTALVSASSSTSTSISRSTPPRTWFHRSLGLRLKPVRPSTEPA